MSVLIKGMEMPSCNDCPLAGDFKCNLMPSIPALCKEYDIAVQNGKRLDNCPLVEIPPHGRLIDADALIDAIIAKYIRHERNRELVFAAAEIKQDLADIINELPTIIPAEEGE